MRTNTRSTSWHSLQQHHTQLACITHACLWTRNTNASAVLSNASGVLNLSDSLLAHLFMYCESCNVLYCIVLYCTVLYCTVLLCCTVPRGYHLRQKRDKRRVDISSPLLHVRRRAKPLFYIGWGAWAALARPDSLFVGARVRV